jgi:3-hydroxyacyl-[acyl-carrier-protein] dehydratase
MLLLDAIVKMDTNEHLIIGYRDIREDEFWCRGHMPGYPIFPGVLMCEAAAQMVCYYVKKNGVTADLLGLGGLEDVRFRRTVRPNDRLILVGRGTRVAKRQSIFDTQGFVNGEMAFEAKIIGIPIPGQESLTV